MRLLLDTHTLIWFYEGAPELSQTAREAIENPDNQPFVSLSAFWEMAIKIGIGRLSISAPLDKFADDIRQNGIQILPIEMSHILQYQSLPLYHRDPFDRILLAQCTVEKMMPISIDEVLDDYLTDMPIQRIW
jgi:PIN domain nuclease of toxin-antitoxin system